MWDWLTGNAERARQFARMRDVVQDEGGSVFRNRRRDPESAAHMLRLAEAFRNVDPALFRGRFAYESGLASAAGLNCGKWACNCRNAAY